jgi:hypothetical protein
MIMRAEKQFGAAWLVAMAAADRSRDWANEE